MGLFKLRTIFLAVLFLISFQVFAQDAENVFEREPGKIECNDEIQRCTYIAQNLTAKELVAKLQSIVFVGSILSPTEGYITVDHLKKFSFYLYDEKLREKFIALIPLLDVYEDFNPSNLVQLTTEIFALSQGASTEIQAQLTATENNPADEIAGWVISAMAGGGSAMGIKLGTNLLSSLLGSSKVKEESSKISTVTQLIPNLAPISYSQTSMVYVSPGVSGQVKEQTAGLSIGGTVSINATDSDLILVKDYNLKYGVIDPNSKEGNERVNILSISNPQLYLVKGTSSMLLSTVTTEERTRTKWSGLSFGKSKENLQNQLMIVTRATAISFKALIEDLKKLRTLELFRKFSADDIVKFPKSEVAMEDVLNSITPYSYFTVSGDRVLGFFLNRKFARESNFKKSIEISIKSGGPFSKGSLKQKKTLTVENLMLSGLKIDQLSPKDLAKDIVEMRVSMKVFQQEIYVNKILYYNTATNQFFEE